MHRAKSLIVLLLSLLLLGLTSAPASAEILFSISADIPVSYKFSNGNFSDAKASGLLTKIRLPIGIGLGLESYSVEARYLSTFDAELDVTMVDFFYNVPLPVVAVVVGGGIGTGKFELVGQTANYDDPTFWQLFASVGYNIAVFDFHVGYYMVRGELSGSGLASEDLDANMFTIGAKIGF